MDAIKLAKGRAVFADEHGACPACCTGGLLTSPHAHARIRHIDASKARALPGVHAVLTHADVPRVVYASGGQSYPNPPPYDQVSLDNKVRHVGDRVAVVAAETPELVQQALELIAVEYEILPAVLDMEAAMQPGAPVIHDEADAVKIHDAERNIAVHLHVEHGDVDAALASAHHIYSSEYRVQQVQQASIEPHIVLSWWDEDDRLVIRTSTRCLSRTAHGCAVVGAAGAPHPRGQTAHRRRFWRQTGDVARGSLCAPDHRHRAARAFRVFARPGIYQRPHPPSADSALSQRRR
ncbi:MAG: molybdopterin-dependent oxidoreductase [Caldilineaceae bacterium]|nr:molybdopterin-dependent oxidoreductase [Caldilineaceae bacterium]